MTCIFEIPELSQRLYVCCVRRQTNNVLVENNQFTNASAGIHVVYDAAFFEGSAGQKNVTIRNNVFTGIKGSDSASGIMSVVNTDPDASVTCSGNTIVV